MTTQKHTENKNLEGQYLAVMAENRRLRKLARAPELLAENERLRAAIVAALPMLAISNCPTEAEDLLQQALSKKD